jgi:hypothetical protein
MAGVYVKEKGHGHMDPPRELTIQFKNPISGSKFVIYRLQAKQEFESPYEGDEAGKHERYVETASNVDPVRFIGSNRRVGPLFYSIYGVYAKFLEGHGLDNCIGDFKTLSDALLVLEGIGVINKKDRGQIIAQALSAEMEWVR